MCHVGKKQYTQFNLFVNTNLAPKQINKTSMYKMAAQTMCNMIYTKMSFYVIYYKVYPLVYSVTLDIQHGQLKPAV